MYIAFDPTAAAVAPPSFRPEPPHPAGIAGAFSRAVEFWDDVEIAIEDLPHRIPGKVYAAISLIAFLLGVLQGMFGGSGAAAAAIYGAIYAVLPWLLFAAVVMAGCLFAKAMQTLIPPAATSNSPSRGRVKLPQVGAAGRGMLTRCESAWQLGWRLP